MQTFTRKLQPLCSSITDLKNLSQWVCHIANTESSTDMQEPITTSALARLQDDIWIYLDATALYGATLKFQDELLPQVRRLEESLETRAAALVLWSQMRTCIKSEDGGYYSTIEDDIQAIDKCPVLLASKLNYPQDITMLRKKTTAPPPEHGTVALVQDRWYVISELPEQAQKRQEQISHMLAELPMQPIETPECFLYPECAEELIIMIQRLAQDYYQHHLQETLERVQKRPLTIDPSLPSGDIYSLSCFPVLAVNAGIWGGASGKKKGWKEKRGKGPQFELSSKKGDSYTAMEYNTAAREAPIEDALAGELWKQIDQYRDHDADAFAIALAYSARVKGQSFWVFGDNIQDHRGKEPKKHDNTPTGEKRPAGHRIERSIPYGESFASLSNTWINIRQVVDEPEYDKKSKRRKQRVFTHSGRLLMVEQVWYQKEFDPDTGEAINGRVIGWKIRVGEWLQTYLEFPNEQIALLSQKILNYDPHNNPWEKRLGYYFFVHGHISNPKGGSATFNREIEDLLDTVSLDIDSRFPQRTRDRFEKAMNRLKEDNIISDWHYKEELNLPSKRWQEQWLKSMVTIHVASRKVII